MQTAGANKVRLTLKLRQKIFHGLASAAKAVLGEVDLSVSENEFVAITGPSGCGKTTLLNIIAGLDTDYQGQRLLQKGDTDDIACAYVFQNPSLLAWRSVEENIRLVSHRQTDEAELEQLLSNFGLQDIRHQYPNQISLGMARRVSLARAFNTKVPLLLMDEPFVSLDEHSAQHLRELLLEQVKQRAISVIFVTHNLHEAIYMADRLIIMGGTPATIIEELVLGDDRGNRQEQGIQQFKSALIARYPTILL
ncbi:MAG: ATP-binding cassette domain-containing protein [Gammaproteobacteria bacterium]|nr:ATP-binding cassette domain-containing protein [Gammaproteobacteria bacterium]